MSLSGFSDSRCSSWAQIRFAIVSSIGVPRKMMCSLSRREYRSKARSPRLVCLDDRGNEVVLDHRLVLADEVVHSSPSVSSMESRRALRIDDRRGPRDRAPRPARAATRAPCACVCPIVPPRSVRRARSARGPRRRPAPRARPPLESSVSSSSSLHSMPSASATARSARSTFTAAAAVVRSSSLKASGSVPVMARYCSSGIPWACRRMARSWRRSCISG